MTSIGVNAGNVKILDNKFGVSGNDGFYIDAPMAYQQPGEEKARNEKRTQDSMIFLTIGKLCGLLGMPPGGPFTLARRQEIRASAQNAANLIVPDIAREPAPDADEIIALVPINDGDSLTALYAKKHLFIELGMAIAWSGGPPGDYEIVQLSYAMEKHFSFTDLEIRALTALKDFSLSYAPDMQIAAKRLASQLSMEERLEASKMMTTIAAAGGQLARMEFDTLGLLFDIMGLGDEAFNNALDELHLKRVWVLLKNNS
ncbi:MAG: TerB family tellurite resistance protein [Synergistaceae bacterium]|nr:TerB family tellurite resistance protein [Synergistaceae bacterium]